MKTIICGPPHSGKSVLIANLIRFMPSDSYLRINANGHDEVVCRECDYMNAKLSGLERGRFLFDSVVVRELADLITEAGRMGKSQSILQNHNLLLSLQALKRQRAFLVQWGA